MALIVLAALCLGACGTERATTGAGGEAKGTEGTSRAGDDGAGAGSRAGGVGGTGGSSQSSGNGGSATSGARATPTASPASPYVEPGAGDGAPHYRENNGFRISGGMSAASAEDARREADRIEPVLKRLWQRRTWDPKSVRAAMLGLGYREERFDAKGNRLSGALQVRSMNSRFENGREVRPEGALVGLRVHDDACVTAFVQKTNYQVSTNGPYPETGCFEPPAGH
ncbi:hypothetical protein [Streptomyces sp. NPDC096012]|uniref:hypothetical protein n=1 Tax=Streptomyces sp. NPDC096012 TaxID=3155684 RepID=UPI00336ADFDB